MATFEKLWLFFSAQDKLPENGYFFMILAIFAVCGCQKVAKNGTVFLVFIGYFGNFLITF